jgi:multiple sugar transport system permease protein/putative aldouronate transport system permease protein
LSTPDAASRKGFFLWPQEFSFINYIKIFEKVDLLQPMFISVSRTILGTGLMILATSLFAFVLTQEKLPFRKLIFRMVVITMYVDAGLIPKYILMDSLGLTRNFLVYILPTMIVGFNLILVKTYIESIPKSLEESATIDGASPFLVFSKIIFPLCKPIIATIAVFGAVFQWNMWFDNFIYADIPQLKTLQLVLMNFLRDLSASQLSAADVAAGNFTVSEISPKSIQMTITFIVTLPVMIVYPSMQRYFVRGIMVGAVKG